MNKELVQNAKELRRHLKAAIDAARKAGDDGEVERLLRVYDAFRNDTAEKHKEKMERIAEESGRPVSYHEAMHQLILGFNLMATAIEEHTNG